MNRKLPKSHKIRPQDYAVDDRMVEEVSQGVSELRRLGVSPAPFNLALPWSEQVRSVRLDEFLSRIRPVRHP
jgi:hypothetical protein